MGLELVSAVESLAATTYVELHAVFACLFEVAFKIAHALEPSILPAKA